MESEAAFFPELAGPLGQPPSNWVHRAQLERAPLLACRSTDLPRTPSEHSTREAGV